MASTYRGGSILPVLVLFMFQARTKNSVLENKAVKAPNPYAKNPDMDVAMMLAEMSSGSSSSSSDDEIPESAKRRQAKTDMEDEDYVPEKEYPSEGAFLRAIQESKEKKKSSDDSSSPLGVKCHVSYCWCSVQPGKNHCGLPGHEHRLNTFGDRLCSIPGCNESTFNLQTEKCNLHLESRRVPRASEKKSVAPVVKQQQKTLDPTDFNSYTVKNDIVYSDHVQIRVLGTVLCFSYFFLFNSNCWDVCVCVENKETKDLLYHSPAIATIWYKPCVRHNRAEKFAASSSIVQYLNDTGDDYLCIEGGGLKGGRTAYLTQEGLKKTLQKRKADDKLYVLFGLPVPQPQPKEESKSAAEGEEENKKEEKQKKKKRKRQEVEHVIQCGHHGCLRSVPTSLDTLCNFHQAEADECKQEEEARNSKNALMLQGMMLDNDTTLEPPAQEEEEDSSAAPPPTKKLKTKEEGEESKKEKKSVRWQCLNCNKEAVEGMAHCSDHIPSPDLSDTAPQLICSVEPLALPKPAVTFAAAAMAILTKKAMESSSSTVPMKDDDKNMSSGPGVVLPSPEQEPAFVCADIPRRNGRTRHSCESCLKEFKDTGRCEFHYNKLTGGLVTMGLQTRRMCHYPSCKQSPPSELINFCGDEAHKIRPDNQGARYCKTPTCLSVLSPGGSEFHCILHAHIPPARARASKARVIQEDTICTWDGECQETIADPNSLLCGKHHQESKARQEAVNKAKQEKKQKQPPPMVVDLTVAQETKKTLDQSEVDKLKAENEALQRQLKLNTSVAFMCNKTDMLKSLLRQAEYLKTLYLPAEQHKEILTHLEAVHNLVKEYAGRRV